MATQTEQGTSPIDEAKRWGMEIDAAKKALKKWHDSGDKVVKRYLDERNDQEEGRRTGDTCWTLFTSNVQTQQAMMYGQTPRCTVTRRFSDSADDVARVAGVIAERLLNTDIERDDDCFRDALWSALEDYLLPGIGVLWLRYDMEQEPGRETPAKLGPDGAELAPAVPAVPVTSYECVCTDYVHWRDFLWSPARTWDEVRWLARRAQMTREGLIERFGKDKGAVIPLDAQKKPGDEGKAADPWSRADVWEIWDKEREEVVWYVAGHPTLLDKKPDPLGLTCFFPVPRPMFANVTTSALVPKPTYSLTQDLYEEINLLSTRITLLEQAVAVRGVYDATDDGLKRLLTTTARNELIPAKNWAALMEKGGLAGSVQWMPLEMIVSALTVLAERRKELIDALNQLNGMSDIMRGQASNTATATEQRIKANFGSVRMQRLQAEFARFASDAQRIKFEIIAKHFDPATIIAQSNIERTQDAQLAQEAVALLQSDAAQYRVEIKPEAISLTDFAAQKQDATEFVGALATFMQAAGPVAQQVPGSLPFLLEMLKWSAAKFRGAGEIEGVLDQAIEASERAAQQPQRQAPDPKLQAIQAKGAQDIQKLQVEHQLRVAEIGAEVQAEDAKQRAQTEWNVREHQAKENMKPPPMPGQPGGMGR